MYNIISVTNFNHNSCKTSVALNLAASFAIYEKKTLLIDVASNFTASKLISLKESKSSNLQSFFENECNVQDTLYSTELNFLKFIPQSLKNKSDKNRLKELVDFFKKDYDYIIFDNGHIETKIAQEALSLSNHIIMPMQCKDGVLENLLETLKIVRIVRQKENIDLKLSILFTLLKSKRDVETFFKEEVLLSFKRKIFESTIPYDLNLVSDFEKNFISALSDIKSSPSTAYLDLSLEIMTTKEVQNNG